MCHIHLWIYISSIPNQMHVRCSAPWFQPRGMALIQVRPLKGFKTPTAQGRSVNNRPCCGRSSLCILHHRIEAVGASAHSVIAHDKRSQNPASRTSLALNEGNEECALFLRRVYYSTLRCVCVCVCFFKVYITYLFFCCLLKCLNVIFFKTPAGNEPCPLCSVLGESFSLIKTCNPDCSSQHSSDRP